MLLTGKFTQISIKIQRHVALLHVCELLFGESKCNTLVILLLLLIGDSF